MNTVAPVAIAALLVCLGRFLIVTHTVATPLTTLDVYPNAELACDADHSASHPIELAVGRDHLIVSERGLHPRRVADPSELHKPLQALVEARPERAVVKLHVEDDVEHARLVAVLDVVAEHQLTFPVVVIKPPPALDPDAASTTLRALFTTSDGPAPL